MATLTETAYNARRAINWGILAIISYILLRIFWSIFVAIWIVIFPPRLPPPNHAFGVLPAIVFPPPVASPSGTLTFTLETIQGTVPAASPSATVYFMPKAAANLLALTKTQDFARRLQLNPTPIAETKNIYRFDDPEVIVRRMRYDIVSGNFVLRYAFEQDTGVFSERNIPSSQGALAEARNLLQTYDLFVDDFAQGKSTVSFLRLAGNRLIPIPNQSQADAVRVDFFRKSIGLVPVVTPYPDEGLVSVIFSGSNAAKKRILQIAYTYWPIDFDTKATYGLKTSLEAWQELQSGKGFIARYPRSGTAATVRNVYLGYYDSYDPQTYLQPVFIFEGDDGFLGYVPAVAPPWTE